MNTEPVPVTLTLGNIELNAYRLRDCSYSALGLFKLNYTEIYRYGESWYWLGYNGVPNLGNIKLPDGGFLAFQGNKLCYRYVHPLDPEKELYVSVPIDLQSVIEFCVLGKTATDKAISRLGNYMKRWVLGKSSGPIYSAAVLIDTVNYLPEVNTGALHPLTPNNHKGRPSKNSKGCIYLVKLDAHLKLGFTRNINKRLKSFETTNTKVKIIKTVEGTLKKEKKLHSVLGSKVRELYDFEDEQRIIEAMDYTVRELNTILDRRKN
jgi:hypothetical protein